MGAKTPYRAGGKPLNEIAVPDIKFGDLQPGIDRGDWMKGLKAERGSEPGTHYDLPGTVDGKMMEVEQQQPNDARCYCSEKHSPHSRPDRLCGRQRAAQRLARDGRQIQPGGAETSRDRLLYMSAFVRRSEERNLLAQVGKQTRLDIDISRSACDRRVAG